MLRSGPTKIVCLTEEPTEILYALGEGERIVGISAYTVRPTEAKRDKPIVSAFIGGSVEKICALQPDLIVGFSDIQATLARELIAAHQQVLIFNQRSVDEIFEVIQTLANIVGAQGRGESLCRKYREGLASIATRTQKYQVRPKIYFEEWDEPMISGIRWVSELVELAGGEDVFAERSHGAGAKERFVQSSDIIAARPDIILASWCGKPVSIEAIRSRPGWADIPAVRHNHIVELPPEIILQPGPAALTDGIDAIVRVIEAWQVGQADNAVGSSSD